MEQIRSADVLANFPQVDEEKLNAALAAEAAASNRKIIVLDDDPTGVQTVHDIYVYTNWTVESLRKGFAAPEKLFFILTNSRGFTVAETTKAHREIAENTAKVAREFGMDYLIISRGDSTLRGHYPLETDLLREVTEAENGYKMDGDILCPYFREGGRFTPVSYTHLDVYKRQDENRAAARRPQAISPAGCCLARGRISTISANKRHQLKMCIRDRN